MTKPQSLVIRLARRIPLAGVFMVLATLCSVAFAWFSVWKQRYFSTFESSARGNSPRYMRFEIVFMLVLFLPAVVKASVREHGEPRDIPVASLIALRDAAASANPGDRILLAPGVHEGSLFLADIRAEPGRPITVTSADPTKPSVIKARHRSGDTGERTECIHLSAPAYVTLENLVLEGASGNGLNIDDGGLKSHAPGVTLRNITVRDIGPGGNADGIKLSGLSGFLVEHCTIERWGNGGSGIDLVGCHDGRIVSCTLRHEAGTPTAGASGIQAKGGSRDILIRSCRFENAGQRAINAGGSTGLAYFRPPLAVLDEAAPTDLHLHPTLSEAAAITVEGCTIIGADAAIAFVGVDGAVVRFNTIYHPNRWAFRVLQETRDPRFVPCRKVNISKNLIVFGDLRTTPKHAAVNIGDATDATSFMFSGNVWYFESDPGAAPVLPVVEIGGTFGKAPRLTDPARRDLSPAKDGPAATVGAHVLPGE